MDFITEFGIKIIIMVFMWVEFFWELNLSLRQYNLTKRVYEVPPEWERVMSKKVFEKARLYMLAKLKFGMVKDTFSIVQGSAIIWFEVFGKIWATAEQFNTSGGEVLTSCLWLFILTTILTVIDLPFTVYNVFVLEEKFGFNNQSPSFFVWDKIKTYILSQIFTVIISAITVVTIKSGGENFFFWLWLVVCAICLITYTIYPSLIAPLFDKFTPLSEGTLRTQIENLASQLKFPLTQLYVVEGSKRSSHSNAYFYGLFNSKRIVLFDTLLASKDDHESPGCTDDQILAVLSHELGHWHHGHVIKNFLVMQTNLFLLFVVFSYLFKSSAIYRAFGVYDIEPVIVGLCAIFQYIMLPYNALLGYFFSWWSRRFEFEADSFAVQLGKAEHLTAALVQLNKDNLGFPIYDHLYSAWHHSHPPLLTRIKAINKQATDLKRD